MKKQKVLDIVSQTPFGYRTEEEHALLEDFADRVYFAIEQDMSCVRCGKPLHSVLISYEVTPRGKVPFHKMACPAGCKQTRPMTTAEQF